MRISELPRIDEHATTIAADADAVWSALVSTVDRASSRPGLAIFSKLVGCVDSTSSGPRPLAEGSTIPGFRVAVAVPPAELVLEGRHYFSTYALTFRLSRTGTADAASRLTAESRGTFPGLHGAAYRLLVIGTRGHVLAVKKLLATVKRRSEA